jgi:hypothetical protein
VKLRIFFIVVTVLVTRFLTEFWSLLFADRCARTSEPFRIAALAPSLGREGVESVLLKQVRGWLESTKLATKERKLDAEDDSHNA